MQIGYTPDFRTPKPEQSVASIIRFKCNANYFTVVGFFPPPTQSKSFFQGKFTHTVGIFDRNENRIWSVVTTMWCFCSEMRLVAKFGC